MDVTVELNTIIEATAEINATAVCADATAVLKDTAGATISTTGIAAGATENITAPDGVATNSDDTYSLSVKSNGAAEIPDITLTQPNGDIETHPSVKNLTCDTEIVVVQNIDFNTGANLTALRANTDWESYVLTVLNTAEELIAYNNMDIVYNFPPPTGQTTSYATGDDGYQWTNVWQPYFATVRVGRRPQLADFTTLISNNSFGNTLRFTDSVGGTTYGAGNGSVTDYVIDHYTGLGWYRIPASAVSWANAIANAEASSQGGFTDWFIPNMQHLISIGDYSLTRVLNYSPFNFSTVSTRYIWSSTTAPADTLYAMQLLDYDATARFRGNVNAASLKTAATAGILNMICRKHF